MNNQNPKSKCIHCDKKQFSPKVWYKDCIPRMVNGISVTRHEFEPSPIESSNYCDSRTLEEREADSKIEVTVTSASALPEVKSEEWGEDLQDLINEHLGGRIDSAHIHEFVRALLASQREKLREVVKKLQVDKPRFKEEERIYEVKSLLLKEVKQVILSALKGE